LVELALIFLRDLLFQDILIPRAAVVAIEAKKDDVVTPMGLQVFWEMDSVNGWNNIELGIVSVFVASHTDVAPIRGVEVIVEDILFLLIHSSSSWLKV